MIEFAELEDFVDLKLKNYSSGMQVRLAFATMVQSDADVMLIDEVLAVGDAAFQEKCFAVFDDLRARGKTIVLVTHDMRLVDRFCDRAMVIHDGRIDSVGDPERIAQRYLDINFARSLEEQAVGQVADRARVTDAWVGGLRWEPRSSRRATVSRSRSAPRSRPQSQLERPRDPALDRERAGDARVRREHARVRRSDRPVLAGGAPPDAGPFREQAGIGHLLRERPCSQPQLAGEVFAVRNRAARFSVVGGEHVGGMYDVDHEIELEPVEAQPRYMSTPDGPHSPSIHGPSALGGEPRRFFNLVWIIATTDFKLTYFGSVLGYLWSLMRPLLLFGVLYLVFTRDREVR